MTEEAQLRTWLLEAVADLLEVDVEEIDLDRPLTELGISSRDALGLVGELEDHLDRDLDATLLWQNPTITALARALTGGGPEVATPGPQTVAVVSPQDDDAVAVVGVGVRLPGDVHGADAFWRLLVEGTDAVGEVPEGRWEQFARGSLSAEATIAATSRRGGFLGDIASFDADFFGISPREATTMDPQQRMLLEVTHEALTHAGVAPTSLRGSATGVYVGISGNEYAYLTTADLSAVDVYASTGAALSIAANRISYLLDLRGPSVALDSACSSSLVAVHQATRALLGGEIDQALVGGVNLLLAPAVTITFDAGGALAADGRCKPFSADADGIARAEGAGVAVLKRLSDAERDGDRVLAVIRGSGVNSDGRSNGMMAPNPNAQEALLRAVYARAGIDPTTVDYVEAHGTGTLLGDPIEAGALAAALGRGRAVDAPLVLGSVKSNLGHLEAAAGITGFVKLVLALHHGVIPPSLHFSAPNPHIRFEESRLRVVTEASEWPRYGGLARGGVSAFGFGGTNAHVLLEEYDGPVAAAVPGPVVALPLSGASAARVSAAAGALADHLEPGGAEDQLPAVAATLARLHGPSVAGPQQAVAAGRDRAGLVTALRAIAGGDLAPGALAPHGVPDRATTARPVWVFSGYGSQWEGMGARLLADEPAFAAAVDDLEPLLQAEAGLSLRAALTAEVPVEGVADTQIVIFGVQVALAGLWRSYGLRPAAVIGHSMGEVAAAVVSGALDVADGVRVMAVRSRLLASISSRGTGAMAVLALSPEELAALGDRFAGVEIAVHASPSQITVAGDSAQVAELVAHVESLGRDTWPLKVSGAGHSAAVEPVLEEMAEQLSGITARRAPAVPHYSTVLADPREQPAFDAAYWRSNARHTVRFAPAVAAAAADGHRVFLEVSPHPVALAAVSQTLEALTPPVTGALAVPTLRRHTDDTVTFRMHALALAQAGAELDLAHLVPPAGVADLPLPAWRRRRFWVDPPVGEAPPVVGHPLLGAGVELPEGGRHVWRADLGTTVLPWLRDHQVFGVPVLPGAAYAEMALAAAGQVLNAQAIGPAAVERLELEGLELHEVLALGEHTEVTTSLALQPDGSARVDVHARPAGAAAGTPMVRHATATVRRAVGDVPTHAVATPRPQGERIDLYASLKEVGHEYGPAFSGVGEAVLAEDGSAVAEVSLPEPATSSPRYGVHPAMLDVCLQVLGVAAHGVLADGRSEPALYLPMGIGKLRVVGDPQRGGRVTARLRRIEGDSAGLSGSLTLATDDGEVLLEAAEVYLRRLARDDVPVPLEDLLLSVEWEPAELAPEPVLTPGGWLLLTDPADLAGSVTSADLAVRLRSAGHTVTERDWSGEGEPEGGPAAAVAALHASDAPAVHGVVLFAPRTLPIGMEADVTPAEWQAAVAATEATVVRGARLAAELAATAHGTVTPRLWLVGRGGVGNHESLPDPGVGALRGLVRVLAIEHPELAATVVDLGGPAVVDLSGGDVAHASGPLVAELLSGSKDDEVSWLDDERRARRLVRPGLPTPSAGDTGTGARLRDGAYVVTGGLGGLGLVVARRLAERGATRIVLSGRSAPGDEALAVIEELETSGTPVEVVRGDVAEPGVAEQLVEVAKAGGVPLRGVIHAAGVLADQPVTELDADSLTRVWRPKVEGAWRLHEATLGEDSLEVWAVFSSAAGLLGSPGQASYATANAYLDALVARRRALGLPGTTFQWGAWSQVGGATLGTNALLEPLPPEQGLEAMEVLLAAGREATGVIRLTPERIASLLPHLVTGPFFADLLAREAVVMDEGEDWDGVESLREGDPATSRQRLADRLRSRVSGVMGFDPDTIDATAPLTSLGVDSLMAVRAKNAVEHDLGLTLPVRLLLQGASLADLEEHLAGELGLVGDAPGLTAPAGVPAQNRGGYIGPRDATERWLTAAWEAATGTEGISVRANLAELGVPEEAWATVRRAIGDRFDEVDASRVLSAGTIEHQADLLRDRVEAHEDTPMRVLRAEGTGIPLFLFHPAGGPTSVYLPLLGQLPDAPRAYGFERIEGLRHIEQKAAHYIGMIRAVQPHGPYRLGGWSLGGALAYETAQQLRAAGEQVEIVIMIDSILAEPTAAEQEQAAIAARFERFVEYLEQTYELDLELDVAALMALDEEEQISTMMEAVARAGIGLSPALLEHQRTSYEDARIAERYRPQPYDGRVVLYRASDRGLTTTLDPRYARTEDALGWDTFVQNLEVVHVPGDHTSIIDRPHVDRIAAHVGRLLSRSALPAGHHV